MLEVWIDAPARDRRNEYPSGVIFSFCHSRRPPRDTGTTAYISSGAEYVVYIQPAISLHLTSSSCDLTVVGARGVRISDMSVLGTKVARVGEFGTNKAR